MTCGTCTLCCKLLGVDEVRRPMTDAEVKVLGGKVTAMLKRYGPPG